MRLLSAALLLTAVICALAASSTAAVIFQGFRYGWEREVLGFTTPHRLGSFAAYVEQARYFVCRFTPGVDGDYAHPRLFYAVLGEEAPISSVNGLWQHTAHDRAVQSDHPFAETRVQDTVVIAPSTAFGSSLGSDYDTAVVLNGFNISMECDAACGVCNSDGAWVYSLNMSISNCANQGSSILCEIAFGLGRGWTPTHGGGKSFNLCMTYHINLYFLAISYPRSAAAAVVSDAVEKLGWLSDGVASVLRSFETPSGAKPVFTGINAFGWDLLESDGHADRGRYLESYHFSVTQPLMSSEASFTYNVSLGLSDPILTTVPSRVRYHVSALTLLLPSNGSLLATQHADATICKDDPATAFYCSTHGLNASLVDSVPLQL